MRPVAMGVMVPPAMGTLLTVPSPPLVQYTLLASTANPDGRLVIHGPELIITTERRSGIIWDTLYGPSMALVMAALGVAIILYDGIQEGLRFLQAH